MRSIGIICSFMFCMNGFSQDTLATVLNHYWAAGQCCSSGTDISFTLSDELNSSDFDSLVYVSSGSKVVLYPADFHTQVLGQKSKCVASYGWNTRNIGNHDPVSTVYYGLPQSRFSVANYEKSYLLIYTKNEGSKRAAVNEQFSITAFP